MTHTRIAFAAALGATLVASAGCGKKDGAPDKSDKTVDDRARAHDDQPAAKKPLVADFFGKTVAPPGALAKLKWGMPGADARKAAPELFKPGDGYALVDDATYDKVSYGVEIDKDKKIVSRMEISIPDTAKGLVAAAWGAGKDAKDSIDKPRTYWFDATAGWRAYLAENYPGTLSLEFMPYLPAAKLLGDGADTLGFAPQGILGANIADLRTRFAATLVETDAAQAAAEQKKVGDFAGKDLDKELGAAKPSVRLDLAPTEWGEYWTRIQIEWSDDGKVEDVWFDLPYEAYAPAKAEIRALLEKKWGAPTEGTYLAEKVLIFHDKAPRVIVTDDTISHAWNVRVTSKVPSKDD